MGQQDGPSQGNSIFAQEKLLIEESLCHELLYVASIGLNEITHMDTIDNQK